MDFTTRPDKKFSGNQRKKFMKKSISKSPETQQTPVFPQTLHRVRPNSGKPSARPLPKKRDNIFSQSRDTREDRSLRQMKNKHNSQTFFRDHGNSSR
jgi:hypothetical protein